MEFKNIENKCRMTHLSLYNAEYVTKKGTSKDYELVSRKHDMRTLDDLQSQKCDGIIMAVFTAAKDSILLEREFRPAVGDFIYNFPAGLIEEGETAEEAGIREVEEETGIRVDEVLYAMRPSYGAAGISNELTQILICTGSGVLGGHPEPNEEIEANWYSKTAVARLLDTAKFSARAQMLCYLWAHDMLNI